MTSAGDTTLPGDESSPRSAPLVLTRGQEIGRYVVLDRLGAGGMGVVVAAYDPELDRKVAIKLLHVRDGQGSDGARQLLAEAQALARLSDPNVVTVHDVGVHEGRVFVAMESIEGHTLVEWLATPRPWAQVLDVMISAGRGLAAAHARHLVHGDFKLANVMIGHDGRVRVMDFGLALADEEPPCHETPVDEHAQPRERALRRASTGRVRLAGTPAYMAPEQLEGGYGGPAADQYGFCVTLWEGLYGQRPFVADTLPVLVAKIHEGKLDEPAQTTRVPRWLRRAIERGLAIDPSRRWPSMAALLAALERGRTRRRWQGLLGLGLIATTGVIAVAVTHEPARCTGAELELEGVWDDPTRTAMAAAFERTDMPYAEDARRSTERSLDAYAEQWVGLHTTICEATRVRGDQSEALMDLRIGCLDGKLHDVAALTSLLREADVDVVKNAAQAALALPSAQECQTLDRDALASLVPDDPQLARTVGQVREQLARVHAHALAGKYPEGVIMAQAAMEAARASGYEPLLAEAAYMLGRLHQDVRREPELARQAFEEALYAAIGVGYDRVEALASIGLLTMWGMHLNDTETALRYGTQAEAIAKRMGRPPALEANLALGRGGVLLTAGRFDAAAEMLGRAVEQSADLPGTEHIYLAALNNLATAHAQQGHYREAADTLARALARSEQQLGPWHPTVGANHLNLAATYAHLGDNPRAREHNMRALEILGKALGPDHPDLGRIYHNLGAVQSATGDYEAAYDSYLLAQARKVRGLGPDHVSVAFTANNVGDALTKLGRSTEAIPHFEDALRIWTKAQGENNPSNIYALVGLGEAHLALGRPDEALSFARRALAVGEVAQIDPVEIASAQYVAARALWRSGGDHEQARTLAQAAKASYEASERPSATELAAIEAWLADPSERDD